MGGLIFIVVGAPSMDILKITRTDTQKFSGARNAEKVENYFVHVPRIFRVYNGGDPCFGGGMVLWLACKPLVLDVGCGVMPEHGATREAVGIDINFEHGKVYVEDPIIADAHKLPIRACVVDKFVACAILEHLDRPDICLKELQRVTKPEAYGIINIPINADTRREVFKRFFKEFPCATFYALKKMRKWIYYFSINGFMHKRFITLEFIEKFFKIDRRGLIEKLRPHQWFIWKTPFWLLERMGLISKVYVREMGEYEFCLIKK